jgi:hypothetical protein
MTKQEILEKLLPVFPDASKIQVKIYPLTYKGSMRGYTNITLWGCNRPYTEAQNRIRETLGTLSKTFVTVNPWG